MTETFLDTVTMKIHMPIFYRSERYRTETLEPILEDTLEWILDCNYVEGLNRLLKTWQHTTPEYLLPDEVKDRNAPDTLLCNPEAYYTLIRDPVLEFVLEWMLDCNYLEGLSYFIRS